MKQRYQKLFRQGTKALALVAAIGLAAISPSANSENTVQAQAEENARPGRKDVISLPWWRVRQLKRTREASRELLEAGNRLYFREIQIRNAAAGGKELVFEAAVDWLDPNGRGLALENILVNLELFYKKARLQDVANVSHYVSIAKATAKTERGGIQFNAARGIGPSFSSATFTVPLEIYVTGPDGRMTKQKADLMPGAYQAKMTLNLGSQEKALRDKMLDPKSMIRQSALSLREQDWMSSEYTIADLYNKGYFNKEVNPDAPTFNKAVVLEWRSVKDAKGNDSETPVRCIAPKDLAGKGFPGLAADMRREVRRQVKKWQANALRFLNDGNINIAPAFTKFYYQPHTGGKAADRLFVDNGTLEASTSLARMVAHKDGLLQQRECWKERLKIWKAKASGEVWPDRPKPGSDADRELANTEFFSLPNAIARKEASEKRLASIEQQIQMVSAALIDMKASSGLGLLENTIDEVASVENADERRMQVVRNTLEYFDDPILYGMSEIIHGDFKYWNWRTRNLYAEVAETVRLNRLPWNRNNLRPHFFGENLDNMQGNMSEARVPTNSAEWLQYLYAKAWVSTFGSKNAKGELAPGPSKLHNGGVYTGELLALIRRDLFGSDGKVGGGDDFDIESYLVADQQRRVNYIWEDIQDSEGNPAVLFREPKENERKQEYNGRKVMVAKGFVLNEQRWVALEKTFRRQMGIKVDGRSAGMKFYPFAKVYNVKQKDFSGNATPMSTISRIQKLYTKDQYFPAVGRYTPEIDDLMAAAEAYTHYLYGVRHTAITATAYESFSYAQPNVVMRYKKDGQTDVSDTKKEFKIENGVPVSTTKTVKLHAPMASDLQLSYKTHQTTAVNKTGRVVAYLGLEISRVGFKLGNLTKSPVYSNWHYSVGPGRNSANGEVQLRNPTTNAGMSLEEIAANLKKRREADRKAAELKGPAALKKWKDQEAKRVAREKMMAGDPQWCPHKQIQMQQEAARKRAAAEAKLPLSATRIETAKMGLEQRVKRIPNLTKAPIIISVSVESIDPGDNTGD